MNTCKDQKPQKSTSKDSRAKKYSSQENTNFRVQTDHLRLSDRPRPSRVEGSLLQEDDVENDERDKKGENLNIDTMKEFD